LLRSFICGGAYKTSVLSYLHLRNTFTVLLTYMVCPPPAPVDSRLNVGMSILASAAVIQTLTLTEPGTPRYVPTFSRFSLVVITWIATALRGFLTEISLTDDSQYLKIFLTLCGHYKLNRSALNSSSSTFANERYAASVMRLRQLFT